MILEISFTLSVVKKPTVIVYVDGFNLYRRALEGTPYKWLDLDALASMLLTDYEVNQIRYFTANIKPLPNDTTQALRQQMYLRALRTNPRISIHISQFRSDSKIMPLYPWEFDADNNPKTVRVRKMKEKGSDVELASNFLFDAFQHKADAFILLSNDSDYAEPLRIVSEQLGKDVGVIFPTDAPSKELLKISLKIVRQIREGVLASAQLPIELLDDVGVIRKPSTW